jgi:Transmembrane domain of unknown function (DUF3566)
MAAGATGNGEGRARPLPPVPPKPVVISVGGPDGARTRGLEVAEVPASLPAPPAPAGAAADGNGSGVPVAHQPRMAGPSVTVSAGAFAGRPIGGRRPKDLEEPGRVRLRLARVGPWSVFTLSLLFGTLVMSAVVAGLALLYLFLTASGVIASVEHLVNSTGVAHHFRLDAGWIFVRVGWAAVGLVLVGSLVATLFVVAYNSLADLTGGLDVTFLEHPKTVVRRGMIPTWTARFIGTRFSTEDRDVGSEGAEHDGDGRPAAHSSDLRDASGL